MLKFVFDCWQIILATFHTAYVTGINKILKREMESVSHQYKKLATNVNMNKKLFKQYV